MKPIGKRRLTGHGVLARFQREWREKPVRLMSRFENEGNSDGNR